MVKARTWFTLFMVSLGTVAATASCGSDEATGGPHAGAGSIITAGNAGASGCLNPGRSWRMRREKLASGPSLRAAALMCAASRSSPAVGYGRIPMPLPIAPRGDSALYLRLATTNFFTRASCSHS